MPAWTQHPLPLNAMEANYVATDLIDVTESQLPEKLSDLTSQLSGQDKSASYEVAANYATAMVWRRLELCIAQAPRETLAYAVRHMPSRAKNRVLRRIARSQDPSLQRDVRKHVRIHDVNEVAVPSKAGGEWNASDWFHGGHRGGLARARKVRALEVPSLSTINQLIKLLDIKSLAQLGWMLLATDRDNGPYTSFTIGKRNSGVRKICAPQWQLRRVQQRILQQILNTVPAHDAAHGFVTGRSVVTNAAPHVGKALLLKFDLIDFFPTISFVRVTGLFASLGYGMQTIQFSNNPKSRNVAPTLARLCTYADDPEVHRDGTLPQGAPTSPAISNLICRRLDARLRGLAEKFGAAYTRYADDLTFSFVDAEAVQVGRFRWWVDQVCSQEGFFVNQKKFRAIRPSQRQAVTGVVVNEKLQAPREMRRKVRAMIHRLSTRGLKSVAAEDPGFGSHLLGLASYIHMIDPDRGAETLATVRELLGEVDKPNDGSGA